MTARWISFLVLATGLALGGCQRQSENMVELTGRLFVFNYRIASATYLITLKKTAPIPDGATAVAEFENPMGGEPIVLQQKIYPLWDKITLQSPNLRCVRKDRPYAVSIRLVDSNNETLQTIKTEVTSSEDQSVMPTKPLVAGAGYMKNPEVYKADGTVDYGHDSACST